MPVSIDVTDSTLSFSDVTTNDASTTKHGFMPKQTGSATTYYRSDGTQAAPSSSESNPLYKQVRCATTANIDIATALNNADVLDGITLATDDRVLVKNQTAQAGNGIYVVAVAPARATDSDADLEIRGAEVLVQEGTVNGKRSFKNLNPTAITVATTDIEYARIPHSGAFGYNKNDVTGIGAEAFGTANIVSGTSAFATGTGHLAVSGDGGACIGGAGNSSSLEYSACIGGSSNVANARRSVTIGGVENSTNTKKASVAMGYGAVATNAGSLVLGGGYANSPGDFQTHIQTMRGETTSATPVALFFNYDDSAQITTQAYIAVPARTAWTFQAYVTGFQRAGTVGVNFGDSWAYSINGLIRRDNADGTVMKVATTTVIYETDDATFNAVATADNTTEGLVITVTGAADKTVYWTATVIICHTSRI